MKIISRTYISVLSLLLLSQFIPDIITAQKVQRIGLQIQIEILDDSSNTGISDCNVQIIADSNKVMLIADNTYEHNYLDKWIPNAPEGIYHIRISRVGYIERDLSVLMRHDSTNKVEIRLTPTNRELDEITLKPPSSWKHGDTTNYIVDSFKNGYESRLKDIIVNIPGFSINEQKILLYKGRPIQKILVNGNDLFSDNITLLSNNFPVHLLKNIQTIENQNRNQLLKGFENGDDIVLNLALKKTGDIFFGSVDAGIGTHQTYNANPVLLGLHQKLNMGLISDLNNMGLLEDPNLFNDFKSRNEQLNETWMIDNSNSIRWIPDFEYPWYIRNNRRDIHATVQIPSGKHNDLKNKTSIAYLRDRQQQQNIQQQSFFSDSSFIKRIDSTLIDYAPSILSVNHEFLWNINPASNLSVWMHGLHHTPRSHSRTGINTNSTRAYTDEDITDKWNSIEINAKYLKKVTDTHLQELNITYNKEKQSQSGTNISPQWANIYLSMESNPYLYAEIYNRIQLLDFNWIHRYKLKNGHFHQGFRFSSLSTDNNDAFQLISTLYHQPLSNNHNQIQYKTLNYSIFRTMKIINDKTLITLNGNINLSNVRNRKNDTTIINTYKPEMFININLSHSYSIYTNQKINIHYFQLFNKQNVTEIAGYERATSMTSFHEYKNPRTIPKSLETQYSFNWSWDPSGLYPSSLNISLTNNITSRVQRTRLYYFTYYIADSIINKRSTFLSLSLNQSIPSLWLNGLFKLNITYTSSQYFVLYSQSIIKVYNKTLNADFTFRKKIKKKYTLQINSQPSLQFLDQDNQSTNQFINKLLNIKTSVRQSFILKDQIELSMNSSLFNYSILDHKQGRKYIFVDFQLKHKPKIKNIPISYNISINNITNIKNYYNANNYGSSQYISTIPLTPRRISFSLRYEF